MSSAPRSPAAGVRPDAWATHLHDAVNDPRFEKVDMSAITDLPLHIEDFVEATFRGGPGGFVRFMLGHCQKIPENVAYMASMVRLHGTARHTSAAEFAQLWFQRMCAQFRQLAPGSMAMAKEMGLITDLDVLQFMVVRGRNIGLAYDPGSQGAFVLDALVKTLPPADGAPEPPMYSQSAETADMFAKAFNQARAQRQPNNGVV